jgi:type IV secretion system protein VirB6
VSGAMDDSIFGQNGPFFNFDQNIQLPFTNGMSSTVTEVMSAAQGPLTAAVVLFIVVSGILVMRGDIAVRTGFARIIRVSIVVGLLMSTTLYNEYVVSFFTTGLPDWISTSLLGSSGAQPSAHQFDTLLLQANLLFVQAYKNLNFYNVLYSVELALLQDVIIFPIAATFLVFETAKIVMDIVVAIGPFIIGGYLFEATRGVADRWVGKLIGLTVLTLLVDIVLSIIIKGDASFYNVSMTSLSVATVQQTITIIIEFLAFITIASLVTVFLPGIASFLGGGIAVSPLQMANAAAQVVTLRKMGRPKV